jgi:hypothetical protein
LRKDSGNCCSFKRDPVAPLKEIIDVKKESGGEAFKLEQVILIEEMVVNMFKNICLYSYKMRI